MVKYFSLLIAVTLIATGCSNSSSGINNNRISVSIEPLAYFAEAISGKDFEIISIVPKGASAESYEPTPKSMKQVASSSLFIAIGLLENELNIISAIDGSKTSILILADSINLIDSDCTHGKEADSPVADSPVADSPVAHSPVAHTHGADPHFWISTQEARIIARSITASLSKIKPDSSAKYNQNLSILLSKIDSLDSHITATLSGKAKTVIIYHPLLGYLGRQYNISQIAIETDGKEPSVAHIKEIIDIGKKEHIETIFYQSQLNSSTVEAIARELNAKVKEIDPLSRNWLENMYYIVDNI